MVSDAPASAGSNPSPVISESATPCRAPALETAGDLSNVAVLIPALNEARNLAELLPCLASLKPGQVLVCDNGSVDETADVVARHGAQRVFEPRRGYGAACFAGLEQLDPSIEVVAFLDADLSHDPADLPRVVAPILSGACDFVVGARRRDLREPGAMTTPQRFANFLFPRLIRLGWGADCSDLGPLRAIRRDALAAIGMRDRAYGWTIEMQIRAAELGLRTTEIPVRCFARRHGHSKISGTVRGVFLAAYWIIRTCGTMWLTRHRRINRRPPDSYSPH